MARKYYSNLNDNQALDRMLQKSSAALHRCPMSKMSPQASQMYVALTNKYKVQKYLAEAKVNKQKKVSALIVAKISKRLGV